MRRVFLSLLLAGCAALRAPLTPCERLCDRYAGIGPCVAAPVGPDRCRCSGLGLKQDPAVLFQATGRSVTLTCHPDCATAAARLAP